MLSNMSKKLVRSIRGFDNWIGASKGSYGGRDEGEGGSRSYHRTVQALPSSSRCLRSRLHTLALLLVRINPPPTQSPLSYNSLLF